MNVKELKSIISNLPDKTVIVTPTLDHSYRMVSARITTVLRSEGNDWTEDYGEESTPEKEFGKRLQALVIS